MVNPHQQGVIQKLAGITKDNTMNPFGKVLASGIASQIPIPKVVTPVNYKGTQQQYQKQEQQKYSRDIVGGAIKEYGNAVSQAPNLSPKIAAGFIGDIQPISSVTVPGFQLNPKGGEPFATTQPLNYASKLPPNSSAYIPGATVPGSSLAPNPSTNPIAQDFIQSVKGLQSSNKLTPDVAGKIINDFLAKLGYMSK